MTTKHECKRDEMEWREEPTFDGDTVSYPGKCRVCGKEYEQVFSEVDGLWDVEAEEYVYLQRG